MSNLAIVTKIIAEQIGVPESEVTADKTVVADLQLDSLDQVEVAMVIEDELAIEIQDEDLWECKTVADLVALVDRLKAATTQGA